MYSGEILILLIFSSALGHINEASSASVGSSPNFLDIQIPKGQTVEQYAEQMANFWTDARIKEAIPVPLIRADSFSMDKNINERKTLHEHMTPTVIEGMLPVSWTGLKRAGYPNTVGKVFFLDGYSTYMCSASVVTAENKDLIFTAGHCVFSTTRLAFVKNFVFIPQYENNTRPYGTWTARSIYAMSDWTQSLEFSSDVAIVLLYPLNGQHIQDVVGSQGVGFNYGHSANIYSFGYPINYLNAEMMTYCTATKYFPDLSDYTGDAMSCSMREGCSGGPWLASFSFSSLSGIQTSVNSFMLSTTPNVMYGPYFDSSVESLYNEARNSTRSDISKANLRASPAALLLVLPILQQFL